MFENNETVSGSGGGRLKKKTKNERNTAEICSLIRSKEKDNDNK